MPRRLLINAAEPEEIRAAVVEDGRLDAFERESTLTGTLVGNVYKGRVVNLESGIGAAFVDIGEGRNAFLHVSDCIGAGDGARIGDHLRLGDAVVAQVTRDAVGKKGPVLTALVTLPGRFVVLLPHAKEGGVSRRIDGRRRLRAVARELEERAGMGLILRTAAGEGAEAELRRDTDRLVRLWRRLEEDVAAARAPALLFRRLDLVGRAVRDADRIDAIVVDSQTAFDNAKRAARTLEPELEELVEMHEGSVPLFHAHGIERQVDALRERRVDLPGGGSLVIDSTEALVAVDVNSGTARHEDGLEETALQTNLEAAEAVARQLRLRDLGGVVVVDFIDMRDAAHLEALDRAFREHLRQDPVHVRPGGLGEFCLFVLTRQRAGDGSVGGRTPCPTCHGAGTLSDPRERALRVWREIRSKDEPPERVHASPAIADALRALRGDRLDPVELVADEDLPDSGWRI